MNYCGCGPSRPAVGRGETLNPSTQHLGRTDATCGPAGATGLWNEKVQLVFETVCGEDAVMIIRNITP